MNILVVSENFTKGGLETHIHSYYTALRREHAFTFAFGTFQSELPFGEGDVYTGFHFSGGSSVGDFLQDVERLTELVRERGIEVIHVHPFYSIFPAMAAGQVTGVPVVCTHHGPASFTFPSRVSEMILLYYFYSDMVGKVFSVSGAGKTALEDQMRMTNVIHLPNALDTALYRRHTVVNNRRWAVISRLDADAGKVDALQKLFEAMDTLSIRAVDVYGDGSQRQKIETYAAKLGLENRVHFMGFHSDLYQCLDGGYNGIMGSDRAALEGLAMGYPVLELGWGRLCGVFDEKLLELGSRCNFAASDLPECGVDTLRRQLEQVYAYPDRFDFRARMVDAFDINRVAAAYIDNLRGLSPRSLGNMRLFIEQMRELPNQDQCVYESLDVFWLMCRQIKPYAMDPKVQILFQIALDRMAAQSPTVQVQTLRSRVKRKLRTWFH